MEWLIKNVRVVAEGVKLTGRTEKCLSCNGGRRCGRCGGSGYTDTYTDGGSPMGQEICCSCNGTGKPSGGCFISTLIFNSLGQDDNCCELSQLRQFRDEVLLKESYGRYLVRTYYEIAPSLLEKLELISKSNPLIYNDLYDNYLKSVISNIENKENKKTIEIYLEMINYIRNLKV